MGRLKPGRLRGGRTPPNPTTTTIPQQTPSYGLTPLGHAITNQNKLHNTGITPSQLASRHRHRHCRPTGLPTQKSHHTTNYPPRRQNNKKHNKTAPFHRRHPAHRYRIHTIQHPKRRAITLHRRLTYSKHPSRRSPCGLRAQRERNTHIKIEHSTK